MPALVSYDYATLRVVPRVDREEFINAGVIVFSQERAFLGSRIAVDDARLVALFPGVDLDVVKRHLDAISRICAGAPEGGPIARMPARERFHWLVSPRSTVIQVSPVHSGMTAGPEQTLDELFRRLVDYRPSSADGP